MSRSLILRLASVFGFLGVLAGAFGAHGLSSQLTPALLETWKTGAHYQLIHSLALLALGSLPDSLLKKKHTRLAVFCFSGGIVLFSGSLYVLALTGIHALGIITPFGGVLFLVGWLYLWGVR